jgi:hypothetical protein
MNLNNKNHPIYEPDRWNKDKYVCKSHNCYAYALNLIYPSYTYKCEQYLKKTNKRNCPRPKSNIYTGYHEEYNIASFTCSMILKRIKKGIPLIKKLRSNQQCCDGYYKIALFITTNKKDFHFYRQDNTGLWSHKDAWRKVSNKDYKGRLIRNPETASKNESYTFCGYFRIPNDTNKKFL